MNQNNSSTTFSMNGVRQIVPHVFYWRDGTAKVLWGETPEAAFASAGYGGGAINAVDFYFPGMIKKYYWDATTKNWTPYSAIHIHSSDKLLTQPTAVAELIKLYRLHRELLIDFDNDDMLSLSLSQGHYYPEGWLAYIQVAYLEYAGDGGYSVSGTQYFPVEPYAEAVAMLVTRLGIRYRGSPDRHESMSIQEIAKTQDFTQVTQPF
jgi:hypothetical protein